jgi:hypothetical protein
MSTTFEHGARVRHQVWTDGQGAPAVGTVHVFPDAGPNEVSAEVRWDGCFVAEQLDLVAEQLELID